MCEAVIGQTGELSRSVRAFPLFLVHVSPYKETVAEISPSVPCPAARIFISKGKCNLLVLSSMDGNAALSAAFPSSLGLRQNFNGIYFSMDNPGYW